MTSPLPRGRIKDTPEDFVVEEIPAYEPEGLGSHLYLRFTKRGLTTDQVVRTIADSLGVAARDIGVAGLKDKVGVTTQTISLPVPNVDGAGFDERVLALSIPGVTLLSAKRHGNKLKTGHLHGNRFTIRVRGIANDRASEVVATLERAGREGIPNAFGSQRFGRDRDNAAQALAWLTGQSRGPRDPRKKRFLWSALQSDLFNAVLDRRVADGTWRTPLEGDILKKTDSGGLFPCTDEAVDQARAERGEVSPTGPMFGVKMRAPTGKPGELERVVFEEKLGATFNLAQTKPFGEGTRRGLCLAIEGLTVERLVNRESDQGGEPEWMKSTEVYGAKRSAEDAELMVCFVLPKGAYATSVLGAAVAFEPETTTSQAEAPVEEGERSMERAETEE